MTKLPVYRYNMYPSAMLLGMFAERFGLTITDAAMTIGMSTHQLRDLNMGGGMDQIARMFLISILSEKVVPEIKHRARAQEKRESEPEEKPEQDDGFAGMKKPFETMIKVEAIRVNGNYSYGFATDVDSRARYYIPRSILGAVTMRPGDVYLAKVAEKIEGGDDDYPVVVYVSKV